MGDFWTDLFTFYTILIYINAAVLLGAFTYVIHHAFTAEPNTSSPFIKTLSDAALPVFVSTFASYVMPFLPFTTTNGARFILILALAVLGFSYYLSFPHLVKVVGFIRDTSPTPKPEPAKVETVNPLETTVAFKYALRLPDGLRDVLTTSYGLWLLQNPDQAVDEIAVRHAGAINHLMELVPAKGLITKGNTSLYQFVYPTLSRAVNDDDAHPYFLSLHSLGEYSDWFKQITIGFTIPEALRVEHHQILANPGHGKSTLISQMFFDDVKRDVAIVLIDSQGDLIRDLATRVPEDRLILIDPETCPPALNVFAQRLDGEQSITNALSLFEYIFASLGVNMTGKQEMVYRYLSRLCMMIPGGSIRTLRDLLQPGGTEPYQAYIDRMSENAQAFFKQYQLPKNNQFSDTRQEVLLRLLKVLENTSFDAMLGAEEMKIDIAKAIDEGKIILVSTAKNYLGEGSSLLGRIFVAQVMQAVRNRPPNNRRRVYLYIDEFADYAQDSSILLDCFSQGRKYELGMIVAHQNLDQLTPKLAATISSSTAIKFAGGVSAEDARRLGGQMRTDYREIDRQPKGTFLGYFKDIGTIPWTVELGFIKNVPKVNNIYDIQNRMRELYGPSERPTRPPEPKEEKFNPETW